jgi:hypothetical protein
MIRNKTESSLRMENFSLKKVFYSDDEEWDYK